MPLLKSDGYETPHGITLSGTLWLLAALSVDVIGLSAEAVLLGYPHADALAAKLLPVGERRLRMEGEAFGAFVLQPQPADSLSGTLSRVVYEYAVANDPFFEGAEILL